MIERIGDQRELALTVICKLRNAGRRTGGWNRRSHGQQIAVGVIGVRGDVAERVRHGKRLAKTVVSV